MNAAEDRIISEKDKWRESAKYLQDNIIDRIRLSELIIISEMSVSKLFVPSSSSQIARDGGARLARAMEWMEIANSGAIHQFVHSKRTLQTG